jgi:hypothetical protein
LNALNSSSVFACQSHKIERRSLKLRRFFNPKTTKLLTNTGKASADLPPKA